MRLWGRPSPAETGRDLTQNDMSFKPEISTEPDTQPDPNESSVEYETKLANGEYLGILETYGIKWDVEKTFRDIWQNFFDRTISHDGVEKPAKTLDDVNVTITPIQSDDKMLYNIRVEANDSLPYDYRKLLHIGGTSKQNNSETVGGFGEGAKVSALVMMRDFGISDIHYGSSNWDTSFYLDDIPAGVYDKPAKGLYAKLKRTEQAESKAGNANYVEFTTGSLKIAKSFESTRDLFYHSKNPDFQSPTFSGKRFGFKFLGGKKDFITPQGHFYDGGQRRHCDKAEKWDTVAGLNLWSTNPSFSDDRDRGAVSMDDIIKKIIKPSLRGINPDGSEIPDDEKISDAELLDAFFKMNEIFESLNISYFDAACSVLHAMVEEMAYRKIRIDWAEVNQRYNKRYLALDLFTPEYITVNLRESGYSLCHSFMSELGMKTATECFLEMQVHIKSEPTPEQEQKIDLLYQAIDEINSTIETHNRSVDSEDQDNMYKPFGKKDIWLYSRDREKSIINGQYNQDFVWLCEEVLNKPFPKVLATYVHELDHQYGSDTSAEFSYALTASVESLNFVLMQQSEKLNRIHQQWMTPTNAG